MPGQLRGGCQHRGLPKGGRRHARPGHSLRAKGIRGPRQFLVPVIKALWCLPEPEARGVLGSRLPCLALAACRLAASLGHTGAL
jgi:hypothetical protein